VGIEAAQAAGFAHTRCVVLIEASHLPTGRKLTTALAHLLRDHATRDTA
jgi:hypothetical protein